MSSGDGFLKLAMSEAPVLISVNCSPSAGPILVYVDASTTIGWGAILSQIAMIDANIPYDLKAVFERISK
jgi:hypothetical protein